MWNNKYSSDHVVLEPVIKNFISLLALNSTRLECMWRHQLLGLKIVKQEMKDLVSNKLISDLFRLRSSIKFSLVSSLFKVGWAGVESHLQYPGLKEEKRVSRSHRTQQKGLPVASSFTGNPQNCSHLKLFLNYTGLILCKGVPRSKALPTRLISPKPSCLQWAGEPDLQDGKHFPYLIVNCFYFPFYLRCLICF